jgi:phospholipase/carboxylesterase
MRRAQLFRISQKLPDVAFINRALAKTFETVSVDPVRIIAGGFSDGATYAL